jgi:hypothetical protein
MDWSQLGAQFCCELAFGILLALAFVPKAPVGAFFYRVMGTSALVLILAGIALPFARGTARAGDPQVVAAAVGVALFPVYSGPFRGRIWAAGLGLALAATAVTVGSLLADVIPDVGRGRLVLGTLSALAAGAVAGSVGLAMVLGHWYLTVPNLAIAHLERLNRVTAWTMLASAAALAATCAVFAPQLAAAEVPLFGPWGLFYVGTRVAVGLVMPLLFAWMTAGALAHGNTRAATGILYASIPLVLMGTAASLWLQDTYGVPL